MEIEDGKSVANNQEKTLFRIRHSQKEVHKVWTTSNRTMANMLRWQQLPANMPRLRQCPQQDGPEVDEASALGPTIR
jgi:hypothetical protein